MKCTAIAAAVFLSATSALLAGSEGVADFKVTFPSANGTVPQAHDRLFFSGAAYRVEMVWEGSGMKGRSESGTGTPASLKMTMIQKLADPDRMYMVNDEQKSYSVVDLAKVRESAEARRSEETWTVKRLGSDRVAGVSCEKALITSSRGNEAEVCISSEITNSSAWWSAMRRGRSSSDGWFQALKGAGLTGFPVRMKSRTADGKDGVQMELVSLEKKPVSPSLFEIPAGYKKTDAASVHLTAEQKKQLDEALSHMTPEQRQKYEEMMKKAHEGDH